MAEAVVFSLASKILSTIASPAFNKAYEKGVSIWEARDELAKLRVTIETIQAVLLDAEKKQHDSAAVKNWIKRLKGVLYDAEDLFDEVATEDLLKQQMMEGKKKLSLRNQVRVSCSSLNPIISTNSLAKKVKAIRKSLGDISTDMAQFEFVKCQYEKPMFNRRRGQDPGCFVDAKDVIGREEDKKVILGMLFNESNMGVRQDVPGVVAIVGIGGLGKTTLAQLIYNDEEVKKSFEKRWFACISDIIVEREVLGKIFQSITGKSYVDLDVGQLQTKIRESIKDEKYLLVLDDVWEDDRDRWHDRVSLLSCCGTGSRIIVTTRLPSVARVVGARGAHNLEGLSEDDSWYLFKSLAFDEGYENDQRRESLGREILKKCSGVPLAIRSVGSLLFSKNTIREWEAIEKENLPVLGRIYNDETMSVLKLSYDYLPSHLKQCFAYCCLFPKDYRYNKQDLMYHWIAQGYIESNDDESGFMHLLRSGFFQEVEKDEFGEIMSCKMHDLMHDLALYVAGEESVALSSTTSNTSSCARHVFCYSQRDKTWDFSTLMLNVKTLRSLLLSKAHWWYTTEILNMDNLLASMKLLRTLSLSRLGTEKISSFVGDLKLMRHLDLSGNNFEELPNSITNLVNLLSLNLENCRKFKVWPLNFHKLISLRYLNVNCCDKMRFMPEGIGGMTSLHYLSEFKMEEGSRLNVSIGLPQKLTGKLSIRFWSYKESDKDEDIHNKQQDLDVDVYNWPLSMLQQSNVDEDICSRQLPSLQQNNVDEDISSWHLPVSLQHLVMLGYRGTRIPSWENLSSNNLARLRLVGCKNVTFLPPLRCLPNLKWIQVENLSKLEFIEEDDNNSVTSKFFPCLEELHLVSLPKLKRWWGKVAAEELMSFSPACVKFPLLRQLEVKYCPKLEFKSLPLCPKVMILKLHDNCEDTHLTDPLSLKEEIPTISRCKWQLSLVSLRELRLDKCNGLKSLHLASRYLQTLHIKYCDELMSIDLVEAQTPTPSLRFLKIKDCKKLKSLHISARLISGLEEVKIKNCPNLMLLSSDSLPNNLVGCSSLIRKLELQNVGFKLIEHLLSSLSPSSLEAIAIRSCMGAISIPGEALTSLQVCHIEDTDGLMILHLATSPHLQQLTLNNCKGLISVEVEAPAAIDIMGCSDLKKIHIARPNALNTLCINSMVTCQDFLSSLSTCSCICTIEFTDVDGVIIEELLSSSSSSLQVIRIFNCTGTFSFPRVALPSLESLYIGYTKGMKVLHLASPRLQNVTIMNCNGLTSVEIEASLLTSLKSYRCSHLKNLHIAQPNALQRLEIKDCPELGLSMDMDWDSLPNLRELRLSPWPPLEELPQCLTHRQTIGQLNIINDDIDGYCDNLAREEFERQLEGAMLECQLPTNEP